MDSHTSTAVHRLPPRAFAAVVRQLVLPVEVWGKDGAYGLWIAAFSRTCNAAEPWFALGHDPSQAPPLGLDGVEMRGSLEEQQAWSTLWSASRTMEFARIGNLLAARSQFLHTLEIIRTWPEDALGDASRKLREQAREYVEHVAEIALDYSDPPFDRDSLEVPAFYRTRPSPPELADAEPVPERPTLSFDSELRELIQLLRGGQVAVFCGAGISIGSGLPAAIPLRSALLKEPPASEREVEWLTQCELPFEAFLEVLLGQTERKPFLELFACGEPNAAHRYLADFASRGILRTIATTNFDELIERALKARRLPYRAVWRQEDLAAIANHGEGLQVLKLHGTVSAMESLALTMEGVAAQRQVSARKEAIKTVFAHGSHEAVLVLGYSCSDLFDITPLIESLGGTLKRVYFVQHSESGWRAEDIRLQKKKNPFRSCEDGTRLFCDTTKLLNRLSHAINGYGPTQWLTFVQRWWTSVRVFVENRILGWLLSQATIGNDPTQWRMFVQRWWNRVPAGERALVGHGILGSLWYRCGDYRAAKAHFRAALAAATPRVVMPQADGIPFGVGNTRQPGAPVERCHFLMQVGGCHRALSEYKRAMDCFKEAMHLARLCGDKVAEAKASASVGTIHFNTGNLSEAARRHEQSAEIWRHLGNRQQELGSCLANLGNAYGAMKRFDDALKCFQRGIELAQEIGDKTGEGSRLGGLGQVYCFLENWPKAEASHRAALDIAVDLGDRTGIAHQLGGLAMVKKARGHLEEAITDGLKAVAIFEDLGDRQGEARVLGNVGRYYMHAGRIEAAIKCSIRSLEMAAAIGDAAVFENARGSLGQMVSFFTAAAAAHSDTARATTLLGAYRAGRALDVRELEAVFRRLARNSLTNPKTDQGQ